MRNISFFDTFRIQMLLSSSGLGFCVLSAETRIRIPLGVLFKFRPWYDIGIILKENQVIM